MTMEEIQIPLMFYAQWYKENVKPNMSKEQKEKLLRKISDISLEKPITSVGVVFKKEEFPELAPFMHTKDLTGLQLYAVMTEIFDEMHPKHIKKIYPSFPESKKKKLKEII